MIDWLSSIGICIDGQSVVRKFSVMNGCTVSCVSEMCITSNLVSVVAKNFRNYSVSMKAEEG